MFKYLGSVGSELHGQMIEIYWVLLVPYLVFLFALEVLKDESPSLRDILRRLFLSLLMLLTFEWTLGTIGLVGDAVVQKINGLEPLYQVLKNLGPNYSGKDSWFSMRETILYIFSICGYLIAYLGFFVATALTHFVWTILYVSSPLMILMYLSPKTAHVTGSLYKGLIQVVVWKILWSILGVLLLKLAMTPDISGLEDYLMAIIVNLCIGFSMLFIPLATKSLISDGMSSVAGSLAAVPTIAAGAAVKFASLKYGKKVLGSGAYLAKPLTNPITGRAQLMKEKLKPRFERARERYEKLGLPRKLKERPQQPHKEKNKI